MTARTLRVPCADPAAATAAAAHLADELDVDVAGTDGRHVLVPAGWSALFVWDLAETVQHLGYSHDDELAAWANDAATAAPMSPATPVSPR